MQYKNPWQWVPSLYFAEGFPYVLVVTISAILFKQMGISNADITLYTGWLYLPWVIKPIWSPFIDLLQSKRWWVLITQSLLGIGLAAIAFSIPTSHFLQVSLAIFWLLAFSSATHDIAADGLYLLSLSQGDQSLFVGIRNTFYRIASIVGQGGILFVVGILERRGITTMKAWSIAFIAAALIMIFLSLYHLRSLPKSTNDSTTSSGKESAKRLISGFIATFKTYFQKPGIVTALLFILLYRFPEAQLTKIAPLFLIDSAQAGGLALTNDQLGFVQGVIGVIGLLIGGICGGIAISRKGLKYWLWPMVIAISVPDLVYVYLSLSPTSNIVSTASCIFIEQLGYGFGFTAYTLFLIYFAKGQQQTSHYAISTGIMALGMMLPGIVSGKLQEIMGYRIFFIWVIACCIVTCIVASLIKFDPQFGKKDNQ